MQEYRVLTVYEPWASLLVHGFKKVETRSPGINWKGYRGIVLIHAGKRMTKETRELCTEYPISSYLLSIGIHPFSLAFDYGHIIGSVEIYDCWSTDAIKLRASDEEILMGDYSPGRLGLLTRNPVAFKKPIPAKGYQGLWKWTGEIE